MTSKDYLSQNLARNYGSIARDIYGYRISVIDLREPTRSDGNNLLTLINRYMDSAQIYLVNFGTNVVLPMSMQLQAEEAVGLKARKERD